MVAPQQSLGVAAHCCARSGVFAMACRAPRELIPFLAFLGKGGQGRAAGAAGAQVSAKSSAWSWGGILKVPVWGRLQGFDA